MSESDCSEFNVEDECLDEESENVDCEEIENHINSKVIHNQKLTLKQIKVLKEMDVQLQHRVPKQHQIVKNPGTQRLITQDFTEFKKYHKLVMGRYSSEEDKIIHENWNHFCKVHNWDPEIPGPFVYFRFSKTYSMDLLENKIKFVQFLANGLLGRTLKSVFNRFQLLYNKPENSMRGYFTKDEDELIMEYMDSNEVTNKNRDNRNFKRLSQIMDRKTHSIMFRYNKLSEKDTEEKDKQNNNYETDVTWTLPLCQELLEYLLEYTLCDDVSQLKNMLIPKFVWQKIEEKMRIKKSELEKIWNKNLHLQLFSPEPIKLNEIKVKIIEVLQNMKLENYNCIKWNEVVNHFEGFTPNFIQHTFCIMSGNLTKKLEVNDVNTKLNYMFKNRKLYLNDKYQKILQRLEYIDGKLIIIKEEFDITDSSDSSSEEENLKSETPQREDYDNVLLKFCQKLLNNLLELTICSDIMQLKNAVIPTVVWAKLAKIMKVDSLKLKKFWLLQMHIQLFSPDLIRLKDIQIEIIKRAYEMKLRTISNINWNDFLPHFDGTTSMFLNFLFNDLLIFFSKQLQSLRADNAVRFLYSEGLPKLSKSKKNTCMKRLRFSSGILKVVESNCLKADDDVWHIIF